MNSHWVPIAAVGSFAALDVSAAAGVTPAHYAAFFGGCGLILAVLKGWKWVREEVKAENTAAIKLALAEFRTEQDDRTRRIVGEAFVAHEARDQQRFEAIQNAQSEFAQLLTRMSKG